MRLRFRIRTVATPGATGGVAATVDRLVDVEPAGGELRVGRRGGVELELPFATVSGLHARIFRHAGAWAVSDLGSANGSFLGDARLAPGDAHALRPGDTVRVADVLLTFDRELGADPPPAGPPVESTATMARRLVNDLFQAMPAAEVARIVVTAGPGAGRTLALAQPDRAYKVGRAPDCDLVLPDDDVSREHASFERRWQGVFVRDLRSKNGVEIGGERVADERRVADGQVLVVGSSELRVEDPEERYLRQMEEEARELARLQAEASPPRAATPAPAIAANTPPPSAEPAVQSAAPNDGPPPDSAPEPTTARPPRSRAPLVVGGLAVAVLAGVAYLLWSFLLSAPKIE